MFLTSTTFPHPTVVAKWKISKVDLDFVYSDVSSDNHSYFSGTASLSSERKRTYNMPNNHDVKRVTFRPNNRVRSRLEMRAVQRIWHTILNEKKKQEETFYDIDKPVSDLLQTLPRSPEPIEAPRSDPLSRSWTLGLGSEVHRSCLKNLKK